MVFKALVLLSVRTQGCDSSSPHALICASLVDPPPPWPACTSCAECVIIENKQSKSLKCLRQGFNKRSGWSVLHHRTGLSTIRTLIKPVLKSFVPVWWPKSDLLLILQFKGWPASKRKDHFQEVWESLSSKVWSIACTRKAATPLPPMH